MENENELDINSQNDEIVVDDNDDAEALKEKFQKLSEKHTKVAETNKQLFARAKKAEGFELKDGKWLKPEPKTEPKPDVVKNNEPDYGKLAYLKSAGIDNPDDVKIIQDEAERLKLPLTDVLGMEHIKTKLKEQKEDREAKAGVPRGGRRSGGDSKQEVDYWIAKGGLPEDQELAEKVVNARMTKEKTKNTFADELYNQ